ncbi:MAG: alpha/beta fold hydrolase [Candidatus Atribacteria bacterium]
MIFGPGFSVPKQPLPKVKQSSKKEIKPPKFRKNVSFKVGETVLSAWLYLPENLSAPVACVIMSHGFGGTKDMILESYALRFREAGMAVLTYDYRHFGTSEGEPRQLFYISYQLEDLSAAIEYARGLKEIDPEKIALWGTSAAGGYGIVTAAQDKKIACVVGQCPALDSHADVRLALEREGIGFFLRLFVHAQRDMGRSRFGLSAHKIPIVGKPGSLAMITAPGAFDGYSKLVPPGFINEVCARILLRTHGHNPIDYAKDVQCPVLLQICEKDNLVSKSSYLGTAKILGKYAKVKIYPIGHFDIYVGENFEKAVSDQLDFFKKHL